MKKLIALIMVMFIMVSCEKEPEVDYALLTGKIENPKGESITVLKGREKIQEIKVNQDGTFSDTLKIEKGYYSMSHGRESSAIYLEPGYVLNLTLDTKEFDETIVYTGNGSENNNYLVQKYLTDEKVSGSASEVYALEEVEFFTKAQRNQIG